MSRIRSEKFRESVLQVRIVDHDSLALDLRIACEKHQYPSGFSLGYLTAFYGQNKMLAAKELGGILELILYGRDQRIKISPLGKTQHYSGFNAFKCDSFSHLRRIPPIKN